MGPEVREVPTNGFKLKVYSKAIHSIVLNVTKNATYMQSHILNTGSDESYSKYKTAPFTQLSTNFLEANFFLTLVTHTTVNRCTNPLIHTDVKTQLSTSHSPSLSNTPYNLYLNLV